MFRTLLKFIGFLTIAALFVLAFSGTFGALSALFLTIGVPISMVIYGIPLYVPISFVSSAVALFTIKGTAETIWNSLSYYGQMLDNKLKKWIFGEEYFLDRTQHIIDNCGINLNEARLGIAAVAQQFNKLKTDNLRPLHPTIYSRNLAGPAPVLVQAPYQPMIAEAIQKCDKYYQELISIRNNVSQFFDNCLPQAASILDSEETTNSTHEEQKINLRKTLNESKEELARLFTSIDTLSTRIGKLTVALRAIGVSSGSTINLRPFDYPTIPGASSTSNLTPQPPAARSSSSTATFTNTC